MKEQSDVIVVGSGLGGLATACTLAGRGYAVTVVEKNEWLGGKAAVLEDRGYRFDMGPTILTLPSVLRRVFSEASRSLEDYLRMVRLDPQWRCFFEDDTQFDLVESLPKMKDSLREFTGSERTGAGYEKFMGISKQLDEVSNRFFFWKSVGGIADTMDFKQSFSLKVLRDVLSLRFGQTVAGLVRSHIPAFFFLLPSCFSRLRGSLKKSNLALGLARRNICPAIGYSQAIVKFIGYNFLPTSK